jgi:2-keto-3-deoxy-L-rhamnonate aldolase RhmA
MTPTLHNPLQQRLATGGLGLALIVQKAGSADIALAAQACGYDALSIDLEHSVLGEHAAAQICLAALGAGIAPLVRVPSQDPHFANRVLDAGALGVIVPHVENAQQARAVAAACRFAPQGQRSATYRWPHWRYREVSPVQARAGLDAATTVIVMLESPQAIERADEIAEVPGVDILHVGTVDLCDAMGIAGAQDDPRVMAALEHVAAACRRHGKVAGAGGIGGRPALVAKAVAAGVRFVTAGIEWDLMVNAIGQRAQDLRNFDNTALPGAD